MDSALLARCERNGAGQQNPRRPEEKPYQFA
jgi:hypothetical protein